MLGCPTRSSEGGPSRYFVARAETAAAAYHALPGVDVLCSGRVRPDRAEDEAAALAERLVEGGVPSSAIRLDRRALRTLDTIEFLARHHRTDRLLFVSQAFHLPRVLYLAEARGLEAYGLATCGPEPDLRNRLREALGRLRAVWDVGIVGRSR